MVGSQPSNLTACWFGRGPHIWGDQPGEVAAQQIGVLPCAEASQTCSSRGTSIVRPGPERSQDRAMAREFRFDLLSANIGYFQGSKIVLIPFLQIIDLAG